MPVPARSLIKVRRPPEPRIAGGRYARVLAGILDSWEAQVLAQAHAGPLARDALARAWAHLTDRTLLTPVLSALAAQIEADVRRYFASTLKRPQPKPDFNRAAWLDEQFRLLAKVGAEQIDKLLALPYAPREDAKSPSLVRAVNKARKANVALISGVDLKQHTQLVELFKGAQAQDLRHEDLVSSIQEITGFGKNRAKLIARDQTVKHNAAVNAAQAKASGFVEYTWRITRDNACRPMHRKLEGKVFRYDSPPVTNEAGDRNNPGGDYNCRCQAEPKPAPVHDLFAGLSADFGETLGFDQPAPAREVREPRAIKAAAVPKAVQELVNGVPESELSFLRTGYREPLYPYEGTPPDQVTAVATGEQNPAGSRNPLPPIKIAVYPDGTRVLVDGRHRLEAAQAAGATHIRAEVVSYTKNLDVKSAHTVNIRVPEPDAAKRARLAARKR